MSLVLSLFPGIGLLDMAFEEQGFCVVRGPDVLWGGDVKRFHPPKGRFDGVIGGPPCQQFSRFAEMARYRGYTLAENLIPEYERCVVECAPRWFLMENVPDAPEPAIYDYGVISFLLNNRWVGGTQNRLRRFSFGVRGSVCALSAYMDFEVFEPIEWKPAVCARGEQYNRKTKEGKWKISNTGATVRTVERGIALQGLPSDFFEHSPFTVEGKQKMIGNGVPLPMGRAIAKAVKEAVCKMSV